MLMDYLIEISWVVEFIAYVERRISCIHFSGAVEQCRIYSLRVEGATEERGAIFSR